MRAALLVAALMVLSCGTDRRGPMDEYCLSECRKTLETEIDDAVWMGNDKWWTRCSCLSQGGWTMVHADLKLSDRPENRRRKK